MVKSIQTGSSPSCCQRHGPGTGSQKDKITIGVSWNEQIHSLVQAWQDYMEQYGEFGAKYGIGIEWVVNREQRSDPAGLNIEDPINQSRCHPGSRARCGSDRRLDYGCSPGRNSHHV